MDEYETLNHTTWDCKYHVVFIPKCRRKTLYQELRNRWAKFFVSCGSEGIEGRRRAFASDHVHMLLSIPPKYAVSQVVGYIKGKSAIHMARTYGERKRNFVGQSFWARGLFREHGRARRRGDPRLHPQPREGRPDGWSNESLA
jgi:putative transposase